MIGRSRRLWIVVLQMLALQLLAAAPAYGQSCRPFWADGARPPNYMRNDNLAVIDDGGGAVFFVCTGSSNNQGERIYKWMDQQWVEASQGLPITSTFVADIRVLDDGGGPRLIAHCRTWTGSQHVYHGRRWNGTEWVATLEGFITSNGWTVPLMSCDLGDGPEIFGYITVSLGRYRFARWDGQAWVPISEEFSVPGMKLIAFDDGNGPRLYSIGDTGAIGGIHYHGFARWGGGTYWERPVGHPVSIGSVHGLAAYDDSNGPAIYVYGTTSSIRTSPTASPGSPGGMGRTGPAWADLLSSPTPCMPSAGSRSLTTGRVSRCMSPAGSTTGRGSLPAASPSGTGLHGPPSARGSTRVPRSTPWRWGPGRTGQRCTSAESSAARMSARFDTWPN